MSLPLSLNASASPFRHGSRERLAISTLTFITSLMEMPGKEAGAQERLRDAPNPDNAGPQIAEDFIVFWASLRNVSNQQLVCAIIGFYRVAYWKRAIDVTHRDCHRNAHTRCDVEDGGNDVVVFANPEGSGRLRKFLEIGCASSVNKQQCVHPHLVRAWGGLMTGSGAEIKNGYIQRSNALPIFREPQRFLKWFHDQKPEFIHANNI
jgi:hypothetical protein